MSILTAKNVSFTYQSKYQKVEALKNVSCTFEPGRFYAIIGQSGSGKTTLLSMLGGLAAPTQGEILAGEQNVQVIGAERHRRENVSIIYQSFNLFPALTVLENVMYPMRIVDKPKNEAREKAALLLKSVGITEQEMKKLPNMLSGGQQQRVAIARALASDAKVILADEPTGNLDTENSMMVIDILQQLVKEKNYCVIVVTHDMEIADRADVIYRMKDGWLTEMADEMEIEGGPVL